jgi:hypothetical protein
MCLISVSATEGYNPVSHDVRLIEGLTRFASRMTIKTTWLTVMFDWTLMLSVTDVTCPYTLAFFPFDAIIQRVVNCNWSPCMKTMYYCAFECRNYSMWDLPYILNQFHLARSYMNTSRRTVVIAKLFVNLFNILIHNFFEFLLYSI